MNAIPETEGYGQSIRYFAQKLMKWFAPTEGRIFFIPAVGFLFGWGIAMPTATTAGYAPGGLFIDAVGAVVYVNEGTFASCDFKAITTAA